MNINTRSAIARQQLPSTQTYQALNNQLTIFLRSWGSSEYNQKVIDEITHYLSTTQADIEVTTPFDYVESLSSLANRTRVAVLLAHDLMYKTDNRAEYVVGFEVLVLFRSKNEIAWASVGRFSIAKVIHSRLVAINVSGTDLDEESLFPAQLIGLEKQVGVGAGSIAVNENTKIVVSSTYDCELTLSNQDSIANLVEVNPTNSTYWFSVVTPG